MHVFQTSGIWLTVLSMVVGTMGRVVAALMREGWLAAMLAWLWFLLLWWEILVKDFSLLHLLKLFHSVFKNSIPESKIINSCLKNIDGGLSCVKFNFGKLKV